MTPLEISDAIIAEVSGNWSTTEIQWPNRAFDRTDVDEFIRPTVLMGDSFDGEVGIGSVGHRNGVLVIDIFTEANTGRRTALGYAGTFETLFGTQIIDGIIFGQPKTEENGVEAEKVFWHVSVTIPFQTFINE